MSKNIQPVGMTLLKMVFSIYLFVTIIVTIIQMVAEYQDRKEKISLEMQLFEKSFVSGLSKAVWDLSPTQIQAQLIGINELPNIVGVSIVNPQNQVLGRLGIVSNAEKNQPKVEIPGVVMSISEDIVFSEDVFSHRFQLLGPAESNYEILGQTVFYSNSDVVFQQVQYGFMMIVLNGVIKTIALWVIFLLCSKYILSRPLKQITTLADQLDFEDPQYLALEQSVKPPNELTVLSSTFNSMINRLKKELQRRNEIESELRNARNLISKANENLEKQVTLRTEELNQTNQELQKIVSELQQTNTQLETVDALKGKFFSIIAHDLRSPLGSLRRMTDYLALEMDEMDLDEIKDFAKRVNEASIKLHNLLENLLHWSRMQTDSLQCHSQALELQKLVQQTIELYQDTLQTKALHFTNNIPSEFRVFADPEMTASIFRNLLSNAIKFTHHEGNIQLSAQVRGDWVEISVMNNGSYIPDEDIQKLFLAEIQFTQIGTAGERGTGLGLLLCEEFVKLHNGKIWISSHKGRDQYSDQTTFSFTLPALLTRSDESETATDPTHPVKILVVDDDEDQQFISKNWLQKMEIATDSALNGVEALEMLKIHFYDLILMDVYMPKMDGIETTKAIVQTYSTQRPKIVALTGDDTPECRQHCMEAGVDDFYRKDISFEEFSSVIKKWTSLKT